MVGYQWSVFYPDSVWDELSFSFGFTLFGFVALAVEVVGEVAAVDGVDVAVDGEVGDLEVGVGFVPDSGDYLGAPVFLDVEADVVF